jgi:hypothetical protein
MDLRPCQVCGSTLTGAFRFCPGCGASVDDNGTVEATPPVPRPERRERRARLPARKWAAALHIRRVAARPSRFASGAAGVVRRGRRAGAFVWSLFRALASFCCAAVGVCAEAVTASVRSALVAVRLQILVQKLHARRAAVIYATGSAVLHGEPAGLAAAKDELGLLDELIAAALAHRSAAVPPFADEAAGEPEAPTQDDVRTPALSRT